MNAAISRGLPAAAQALDSAPNKRANGAADEAGFEEAMQESAAKKTKSAPGEETQGEDSAWRPIRWTLPHQMDTQKTETAEGDASAADPALTDPALTDPALPANPAQATETPAAPPAAATPAKADHAAIPANADAETTGEQANTAGKSGTTPAQPELPAPELPANTAAAAQTAGASQPAPQAGDRARERYAPASALNQPARALPEAASATAKAHAALGEKAVSRTPEEQPVQTGRGENQTRGGGETLLRDGPQQQQQPQPEIRVVSIQRAPAPAASSEQAAATQRAAAGEAAHLQTTQQGEAGRMVQTLKIQLQPAELGLVTARLRIVADQLTVDLQVENAEARHRLSTDSESIVKALRSLGYDIDRVTVQQSAPGGQSNTATGGNTRDGSFQSMNGQNDGDLSRGGNGERSSREQSGRDGRQTQDGGDAANNGLYI
ncbi:flagellar hook-length control protein FliK [Nitratireductor sp. GZWM139]|uniref:flagellar hook-length control protein FliK n=1 Tax=Nitratireductor sp. GZWM139 TaxID=2950541 RepID=UPI0024BDF08F|nr:flagellar hook-length control protein FliK [Nitratireductor sp. GZWM139]MDJ1462955.1 flagellar hook-length control protein FliK [Nitratireductor sp. GZWM139]